MKTKLFARWLPDYGMALVLVGLCVFFSIATWQNQYPLGEEAARQVSEQVRERFGKGVRVLVAAQADGGDTAFVSRVTKEVELMGGVIAGSITGEAGEARETLRGLGRGGGKLDVIAASQGAANWPVFTHLELDFPMLGSVVTVRPHAYRGANFLKEQNLRELAGQVVMIATIAVGLTFVMLAGGIDLSLGSLVGLGAVVTVRFIRDGAGGLQAGSGGFFIAALLAVLACGGMGALTGAAVTVGKFPSFIVTLAMMLVAGGLADYLADGRELTQIPVAFTWLGRGADLVGIPNAVLLVVLLYACAHVLTKYTTLGRFLYAVGGNAEAARFSGVPVRRVTLFAFVMSGALAGLAGVVLTSQLRVASPSHGSMVELTVIAAVLLGGVGIRGGTGKVSGTLLGALTIAVLQNGMKLCGVTTAAQTIALGLVILAALWLDRLRERVWSGPFA